MNEVKMNTASVLSSIVNSYVEGYNSYIDLNEKECSYIAFYDSVGYEYKIECRYVKNEVNEYFQFDLKCTKENKHIVHFENPHLFINNARYEINRIRDIAIFLDWPQDLVDNMFKTQNVNIDLSIKALQEFICLSRDKNNNLIQAYKDTSTKEGIANFIKVCGDLVAFPSEHAQTGDKVLPDITKTTEDKPINDGVVDKAVLFLKAVSKQAIKEAEIENTYNVLQKEIKNQIKKSHLLLKIQDTYVFTNRLSYVTYDPVNKIISLIERIDDNTPIFGYDNIECPHEIQNKCISELISLTYKEFATLEEALKYKPTKDKGNMQNKPVGDGITDDTKAVQAIRDLTNRSLDERMAERTKLLKEMRDDSNSQSLSVPRTSDNKADHAVTDTDQVSLDNLSILDKIKLTVSPEGIRNEDYDALESADHFIVFNIKKNKMFISPKTVENKLRYSHSAFPRTTIWDKEKLMMMIDTCTKVYKEKLKLPK